MPRLGSAALQDYKNPTGHFGFSAAKIDTLEATEYTLVTVVLDESGSTAAFAADMEKCLKEVVEACRKSPRADNLLLRLVAFGSRMREVHGFKLLEQCAPKDYDGVYQCAGMTALYDSSENAVQSALTYAKDLAKNDFQVNGIVIVITDGDDNASTFRTAEVKKALEQCVASESMESLVSILVGVNIQDPTMSSHLATFKQKAGFTQYVELANADAKTLAKLADFISRSVSSQSQALGTGGPSQSLTF